MKHRITRQSLLANLYSIRWLLPLSYAGIALLAAFALGGLLLLTLQNHYNELERNYLAGSAQAISHSAEPMFQDRETLADDVFQSAADIYSFLIQARVRLLDVNQELIADSGPVSSEDVISVDVRKPDEPDMTTPIGPTAAEFDTFLRVQRQRPEGGNPDGSGSKDGPRYPVGLPGWMINRLLTGVVSNEQHTSLHLTVPLYDQNHEIVGYLELSEGPEFGSQIIRDVAEKAAVAGIAAVFIAAVAGWFASRRISHPLLSMVDATRRMAEGDLSVRMTLTHRDELGLLARTFNTMAERVENTILTLKRFVADAAHEINTPITALRTNLELAAAGDHSADFQADMARAQVELERLETLTRGLLTLSRLESHSTASTWAEMDLTMLVRQTHERYASRAEQAGVTLVINSPSKPELIQADERQFVRVLENLLDNALKFTPSGGTVTIKLDGTLEGIDLSVTDTGIGIQQEDLPKLFSRFHRGRNAAAYPGNGLGLVIAKAIVEEHGGQITVISDPKGTQFTVRLPRNGSKRGEP
jgi:signal transduction histidine kinase